MLRKWITLVVLALAVPLGTASAQNTGKLTGTITDEQTGEPLPGANVVLEGTQRGAATGGEGNYTILGIPAGTYDVRASFVGYQAVTIEDVEINAGYTRQLDFELRAGEQLEEVEVTYERPLIQDDAIGTPKVTSADQINNLPLRNASNIAGLQGGVVSNPGSDELFVRGGRDEQVSYYVDGVKVLGGQANVPTQAIQQQETIVGTIPPRYGDAQSGIISITTKSGADEFFGSVEGITSEALDGYGYNLLSGSLGGPILPDALSFYVAAETRYEADTSPHAIETPRVPDDLYSTLQQTPQGLQVEDADGTIGYVPLERGLRPGTEGEILDQLNVADSRFLPDDFNTDSTVSLSANQGGSPISLPNVIDPSQYDYEQSKEHPLQDLDVTGKLTFTPLESVNIQVGGSFDYQEKETYDYRRSLYARDSYFEDLDQGWRLYGSWRQYLSDVTFYELQVDFTDDKGWFHNGDFSKNIEQTLFYGDVSHPSNSTMQSYRELSTEQVQTGTDANGNPIMETEYTYRTRRVADGGNAGVVSPATFRLPGFQTDDYSKYHNQQLRITANATTQLGVHQLEFGGEYEQRERRYIRLYEPRNLARYYNDIDRAEAGEFEGVDNYEDLPF